MAEHEEPVTRGPDDAVDASDDADAPDADDASDDADASETVDPADAGDVADAVETADARPLPPGEVCVLIPTLDEGATIGEVVEGFHEQGYTNVVVVDGNSGDETRAAAAEAGATVRRQSGSGKGQAVREALESVEERYVLMVDGDGTYDPAEADRMLEPLVEGYDHVVGNRFANMDADAMTRLNRVGNRMINGAFMYVHGAAYEDILSGYRAFTTESVRHLDLSANGFSIETELAVECVKHGLETAVVPISYRARPDDSETNLRPIRDGGQIVLTLYALAKTNNPLFYFGSLGLGSVIAGILIATYVLVEWFWLSTSHEVLAIVSAAAILLGVQMLMFGILSDMIVALHREQQRRLERITREASHRDDE